jgi:hypothetical protein
MKPASIPPTVTLSDDNAANLAWPVELTGLSLEEIVNLLLADDHKSEQAKDHLDTKRYPSDQRDYESTGECERVC